jgi:hypothetical protein
MIRNKLNVPGCCEEVDAGLPRVVALERQDILPYYNLLEPAKSSLSTTNAISYTME